MGLFGFTAIVLSLTILPLFIVTVLFNTTPFWTGILAYHFLGDKVTGREVLLMFGVFFGVVAISVAKCFDHDTAIETQSSKSISTGNFALGVASVLWCSWSFSAISIITRKLKEIHFSLMLFHYGWFATSALLGFMIFEFYFTKPQNYKSVDNCQNMRFLCYSTNQLVFMLIPAIFNVFSMNFTTLAF